MSRTQKTLTLGGRTVTLIGTAHISKESVEEVCRTIRERRPDCIAIELDEARRRSIKEADSWRELDIVKVLKNGEGFLLLANLVLSSFQKRMGQNTGVRPGEEMLAAMRTAEELGVPAVMVDRPIQTTFRRAWGKNSLWGKCRLASALIAGAFSSEEVSPEQIEALKDRSEMDSMMQELSEYMPKVKEALIDERDQYLAAHIWRAEGVNLVAVLGAGHLPGVQAHLEKIAAGEESSDTSRIETVPPKSRGAKFAGWLIPILIVALILAGFYFGGRKAGARLVGSWILWNGALAAIGAALAGGHPLTVLAAFCGAPITSLCPLIGVGVLTGITQAFFRRPKVKDMETLQQDAGSVRGFYRNRILRTLLVFVLSSLGSSVGTFAAGADIAANVAAFLSRLLAK